MTEKEAGFPSNVYLSDLNVHVWGAVYDSVYTLTRGVSAPLWRNVRFNVHMMLVRPVGTLVQQSIEDELKP